jgi:hypothetical protein
MYFEYVGTSPCDLAVVALAILLEEVTSGPGQQPRRSSMIYPPASSVCTELHKYCNYNRMNCQYHSHFREEWEQ